jgi:predicted amidohydrolase YtcJ
VFVQAVLIENGIIIAAGSNEQIASLCPAHARLIDAGGGLLLPGFYDSHAHLAHAGRSLHEIQVQGVQSIDALVERGREELERIGSKNNTAIHGTGWNQDEFSHGEKRFPNRFDIDKITNKRALVLSRVCGHTVSCNSKALEDAGIDKNFLDIPGGNIERDAGGNPTGVFHGNATRLIRAVVPPFENAQIKEQILFSLGRASEFGITSAASHDVFGANGSQIIQLYNEIFDEQKARMRIYMQCSFTRSSQLNDFYKRGFVTGTVLGSPLLKMGPVKLFADGSLGSRTAFLLEPYSDQTESRGYQDVSQEEMNFHVQKAHERGYQVVVHAIGDGAVMQVVRAFENVTSYHHNPKRHGIVHCQVVSSDILERMARNSICALVQPVFLTHDISIAVERLGKDRAAFCHAFSSMIRLGIPIALGTDHPVESLNPLDCIQCAVTRKAVDDASSNKAFFPKERLTLDQAVDAYTIGSAFHSREESQKGRIQNGFLADLTLLDKDIFSIPSREIHAARVVFTMLGGEFSYRA